MPAADPMTILTKEEVRSRERKCIMKEELMKVESLTPQIGDLTVERSLKLLNMFFIVDVSGSMDDDKKLPLVKQTLHILTEQLRKRDRVAIVTYASGEKLALPSTPGDRKREILAVVDSLRAGGATAGEREHRVDRRQPLHQVAEALRDSAQ